MEKVLKSVESEFFEFRSGFFADSREFVEWVLERKHKLDYNDVMGKWKLHSDTISPLYVAMGAMFVCLLMIANLAAGRVYR